MVYSRTIVGRSVLCTASGNVSPLTVGSLRSSATYLVDVGSLCIEHVPDFVVHLTVVAVVEVVFVLFM